MEFEKNITHYHEMEAKGLMKDLNGKWVSFYNGRFLVSADNRDEVVDMGRRILVEHGVQAAPLSILVIEVGAPIKVVDIPSLF